MTDDEIEHAYGPRFWATYLANIGLMVAVSLLFRYADFVATLGGSEEQIGIITGIGMLGAITARCFQGVAIDIYGAGRVWLFSLALLVICLLSHLLVHTLQPPWIHILRILYTISLAGAFGASITFVSLRAPADRMGEMIGMLGSSGFIGMAIGPSVGDWLFDGTPSELLASKLFAWSAAAGAFSFCCALLATFRQKSPVRTSQGKRQTSSVPNPLRLVRLYHPGWTLLVGCAMGLGIGLPGTFLSAFAAENGISQLGWFWIPYSIIAFVVRLATRTLADRWGTRPTILIGLTCLAASMLAYLVVVSAATLIIPAVFGGFAHAFLFPATVAEGNHSFPLEYRGLATTLMLMMFDIGLLVGQPAFGWTVEIARNAGFNGYAVGFSLLASALLAIAVLYNSCKDEGIAPSDGQHSSHPHEDAA